MNLALTFFDAPVKGIFKSVGLAAKGFGGFTRHGAEQMLGRDAGRGVADAAFKDALTNPITTKLQNDGTIEVTGQDAVIILNQDGEVITTWATSKKGVRN